MFFIDDSSIGQGELCCPVDIFLQKLQEPRVDNVLFIQSQNKQYRNIYLDLRQIGCYCVRHTILQPILSSVSMKIC